MKANVDGVEVELPDSITTAELVELMKFRNGEFTGDPETDLMLRDCIDTMSSKGAEYTIGSKDRLANFKAVAEAISSAKTPVEMQHIWFTYFYKHYSAVVSYIKNGCQVKSNETIQSRIMDCVVYLLLFNKMTLEIERGRVQDAVAAHQNGGDPMIEGMVQLAVETFRKG